MGEANRTAEARMRSAAQDVVTALDRHGDHLSRVEAIAVLGTALGVCALAWGGEEEVVRKVAMTARLTVEQQRARAAAYAQGDAS